MAEALLQEVRDQQEGLPKFGFMFAAIGIFAWLSYQLGPVFERVLFYGDFKAWTDGQVGTGTPFMVLITYPMWFVLLAYGFGKLSGGDYRMFLRGLTKEQAGRVEFARWTLFSSPRAC